jgi:hypothetical protein
LGYGVPYTVVSGNSIRQIRWEIEVCALLEHGRSFAHREHYGLHSVPAKLLQRGNPLVAVDDYVAARLTLGGYHYDGHLLP